MVVFFWATRLKYIPWFGVWGGENLLTEDKNAFRNATTPGTVFTIKF